MIRFENGMLALDYPMTKEHAQVIKDFVQYIKEQEQERIIKLLEDTAATKEHLFCYVEDCWCCHRLNVIELIKGETK
jgi:hypothetical protein